MKYSSPITDFIQQSTYLRTVYFPFIDSFPLQTVDGILILNAGDYAITYFSIPNEVNTIIEAKILYFPFDASVMDVDMEYAYRAVGEADNTHAQVVVGWSLGSNTGALLAAKDLPTAFTSNLNAGDFGEFIIQKNIPPNNIIARVLGIYIKFGVRESG